MTHSKTNLRDQRIEDTHPSTARTGAADATTRRTLDNGALAITRTLTTATAAIVVEFRSGSRDDPEGLGGLHHFLEHMVFQGAGGRNVDQMAEAFEDIAADVNASTTDSSLRLEVSVMPRHVETALSLLAEMVLRPRMDAVRVENERSVILQEIADDDDHAVIEQATMTLAFGDDPVTRPVPGTAKSVKAIEQRHLVEQHATTFVGNRCTIAVTGPIDHQTTLGIVADLFADMSSGDAASQQARSQHRPGRCVLKGSAGRTTLRMTWPAPALGEPGESATMAAMHILGNGPTSRLMRRLREKDGLCYSVWASGDVAPGHGMTIVGLDTEARQGRRAVEAVMDEIRRLADDVTDVELTRAKRFLEMSMLRIVDRPLSMAALITARARDRLDDPSDLIGRMNAITLDDVRAYLTTMTPDRCAAASMGGGKTVLVDLPV